MLRQHKSTQRRASSFLLNRKWLLVVTLLVFLLIVCNKQGPEPKETHPRLNPDKWALVFEDEFLDGVDINKWNTCYYWAPDGCTVVGNNELEWYLPGNVTVGGGHLWLTAKEQTVDASNGRTYKYTSGIVTTGRSSLSLSEPPKFSFTYGYAEMRAKIPEGRGFWPAFWLLPISNQRLPEMDIMEIFGHEPNLVYMCFHYCDSLDIAKKETSSWRSPNSFANWHTFALNWQPDAMVWYIDGIERFRVDDPIIIPKEPMYLIANLAVGGNWGGPPDRDTPFPSSYIIDYINVWQLKPIQSYSILKLEK